MRYSTKKYFDLGKTAGGSVYEIKGSLNEIKGTIFMS